MRGEHRCRNLTDEKLALGFFSNIYVHTGARAYLWPALPNTTGAAHTTAASSKHPKNIWMLSVALEHCGDTSVFLPNKKSKKLMFRTCINFYTYFNFYDTLVSAYWFSTDRMAGLWVIYGEDNPDL